VTEWNQEFKKSKFLLNATQLSLTRIAVVLKYFNPLKPNDAYRDRTAPLTPKIAFYIFIQPI